MLRMVPLPVPGRILLAPAKTPLPLREFFAGRAQVVFAEIGPEHVHEQHFRIGGLP